MMISLFNGTNFSTVEKTKEIFEKKKKRILI